MPDEIKPEQQKESRTGLYLIGIGILIVLCILALSFFYVPNENMTVATGNTSLLNAMDKNISAILSNQVYTFIQDTNQHTQLAQLILQSNFLLSCTIDSNSATTVEVPQADNSYRKYTKFSAVYCPQGGG